MSWKSAAETAARRFRSRSIALRLSLLFALASAVVLSVLGVFLSQELRRELSRSSEEQVRGTSALVMHVMRRLSSAERMFANPDAIGHLLVGHEDMRLWVYGRTGDIIFASSPVLDSRAGWERLRRSLEAADAHTAVTAAEGGPVIGLWQHGSESAYRYAVSDFASADAGLSGALVVVALDVSGEVQIFRLYRRTLWAAIVLAIVVAAALGYLAARRGLRPLARIAHSARRIHASALHERIAAREVPRELATLVESFNIMLARLEDSFQRLSNFSADLAHEVRTPLTGLLGRMEVALSQPRTAQEYREVVESSVEEAQRMAALIADMLFVARADHAQAALHYQPVDLRQEAERLVEFLGMVASERGISFHVAGEALVHGDQPMLQRALSNLMSNAIRHSPDGGRIDIELSEDGSHASVAVKDRGGGIAPEHRSRVFERFFRADPSRARESGGAGLGLTIVRSIARLHGGEVSIQSESGKPTVFSLAIPLARPPARAAPLQRPA